MVPPSWFLIETYNALKVLKNTADKQSHRLLGTKLNLRKKNKNDFQNIWAVGAHMVRIQKNLS